MGELWLHFFRLGEEVGEVEIDAYLHEALALPRFERDLLAHAANELIDHGPTRHAPYPSEEAEAGPRDHGDEAGRDGDGGLGGAAQH